MVDKTTPTENPDTGNENQDPANTENPTTNETNEAASGDEKPDTAPKSLVEAAAAANKEKPSEDGDEKPDEDKDDADKGDEKDAEKPQAPASADEYDFTIPDDVGLKNEKGETIQFDKDDPFVAKARDLFFEAGIPKEVASKFVRLQAEVRQAEFEAQRKADEAAAKEAVSAGIEALKTTNADGQTIEGGERLQRILDGIDTAFGPGASKKIGPGIINSDIAIELERWVSSINEGDVGKPKPAQKNLSAAQRLYGDQS